MKHLAYAINNIGYFKNQKGDGQKALEYYFKALKIQEEIGDKLGMGATLNSIAVQYDNQANIPRALDYFKRALKMRVESGDEGSQAITLINIGGIYKDMNQLDLALKSCEEAMQLRVKIGDKWGISNSLNNLGSLYSLMGKPKEALKNFTEALAIQEKLGNSSSITSSLHNIGWQYLNNNNIAQALEVATRSLKLSKQIGSPKNIRNAANLLTAIYKKMNKPKDALVAFELFILMNDSLANSENRKASMKSQLKYEFEKRTEADSVKNAEEQKIKDAQLKAQKAQIKNEKFHRYALVGGLVVVILGLVFVINRFRLTRKQKTTIEQQKIIVDEAFNKLHERNKDVMESIYYAEKIQRALMTTENYFSKNLKRLKKNNF